MGLLGFFIDWVADKIERAVDWINDKLGGSSYVNSSVEDQIDVDKVLSEFRDSIQGDVDQLKLLRKSRSRPKKHSTELLCNMLKSIFQKMTEDL